LEVTPEVTERAEEAKDAATTEVLITTHSDNLEVPEVPEVPVDFMSILRAAELNKPAAVEDGGQDVPTMFEWIHEAARDEKHERR